MQKKIEKIVLKNFRCYEDLTIEYEPFPKVMALGGKNGKGKSSAFTDSLIYAFFNKTRSGCGIDELVRWGQKKMSVEVTIKIGNDVWVITRSRPASFSALKNGEEQSVTDFQNAFPETIDEFMSSCVITSIPSIPKLSKKDKETIIEQIGFDVETHNDMHKKVRERIAETKNKIANTKEKITELEEQHEKNKAIIKDYEDSFSIEEAENEVRNCETEFEKAVEESKKINIEINKSIDETNKIEAKEKEIDNLKQQIKLIEERVPVLNNKINSFSESRATEITIIEDKISKVVPKLNETKDFEAKYNTAFNWLSNQNEKLSSFENQLNQNDKRMEQLDIEFDNHISRVQKRIDDAQQKVEFAKTDTKCHSCEQELPEEKIKLVVDKAVAEVEKIKIELKDLENDQLQKRNAIVVERMKIIEERNTLKENLDEKQKMFDKKYSEGFDVIAARTNSFQKELDALNYELATLKNEEKNRVKNLAECEKELSELKKGKFDELGLQLKNLEATLKTMKLEYCSGNKTDICMLKEQRDGLDRVQNVKQERLNQAKNNLSLTKYKKEQHSVMLESLKETETKLEQLEKEIAQNEVSQDELKIIENWFSKGIIKSEQCEAAINGLNERIENVIDLIGFKYPFKLTNDLEIDLECGRGYLTLSSGEQKQVDIIVSLALRQNWSWSNIVVDEALDGALDNEAFANACDIFGELSDVKTIIVTHRETADVIQIENIFSKSKKGSEDAQ